MPNRREVRKVLRNLKNIEGTLALSPKATPLQKFRYDLQQKLVRFANTENLTNKEMASLLGIDEAKMSKIFRNRLEGFSTDRLITLYQKINPKLKLKVS